MGPMIAQMITTAAAIMKVSARPAAWDVRLAMSPKSFPARSRAEPLEPLSLRFSVAAGIINPI